MECTKSPVTFSQILLIEHQKHCRKIVTVENAHASSADKNENDESIDRKDNLKSSELDLIVKWKDFPPNPPPLIYIPNAMHDISPDEGKLSSFHVSIEDKNILITMTLDRKTYQGKLSQV